MVTGTGNSRSLLETYGKVPNDLQDSGPAVGQYLQSARSGGVKITGVVSPYLSYGSRLNVDGVVGTEPDELSTCLHRVCAALGIVVPYSLCRVCDLPDDVLLHLQTFKDKAKIMFEHYGIDDARNHVDLVGPNTSTALIQVKSVSPSSVNQIDKVVGVTNLVQFFNSRNSLATVMFFADQNSDKFGGDIQSGSQHAGAVSGGPDSSYAAQQYTRTPFGVSTSTRREESVSDPASRHGTANVSSGVVRPRRRVVHAKSKFDPVGGAQKAYVSSAGVKFNNLPEIFLDSISRDYAQQILEELFDAWGVDTGDADAVKYAEDLVWAFIIATTASNKADYDREFEIPHASGSVAVNMKVFSRILAEGHAVTRRQFARAVADDMRGYIKEPDNVHLLALLSSRVGCDPQMSSLAFDGSTHCSGLTTSEHTFTRLLESRNLFEDDSLLAEGASTKLMQGMSGGPRSIIAR